MKIKCIKACMRNGSQVDLNGALSSIVDFNPYG